MTYRGDIRLGDTIDIKFTSRQTTGAPFTLAGSPVISAYVGNGTTEITAGITLTVDFDSRTGLNNVRVVASSGNGFATATNVQLVITTGTVNSVSVVGEVVGEFSIENRSALMPTAAARTLDVSPTGEAGLDFNNILSSALVTLHSLTITNATTLTGAVSLGSTFGVTGNVTISGAAGLAVTNGITANITGNLSGSVGSVTGLVAAIWAEALETGFSASRIIRIIAAACAGKVSGGPGSPVFRNLQDTANVITGTADSSGNRTAASYGA